MNIPNQLTLSRIVLAFIFVYFISQTGFVPMLVAALVFTVACLTDYWDGYFAKRLNLESDFGKLMDPIADKFLILAAFLAFVRMHLVADWMVILILGREILVTGLRAFALSKGKVIAAERAGKHKTVSQMVAIFAVLGFIIVRELLVSSSRWSTDIEVWWRCGIDLLMLITVALTLISGVSYLWNNRSLLYAQ